MDFEQKNFSLTDFLISSGSHEEHSDGEDYAELQGLSREV
jgi:hypothetical protein